MKAPTKPYRLYWAQTSPNVTTSDSVATLKVTRKGTIKSISFMLAGVAGNNISGCQQVELSKQSSRNIVVNDTPPGVLAEACLVYGVSAGAACLTQVVPGLDIPVDVGDTLYAHQVVTGTAPASCTNSVQVYVGEV